MTRAGWLTSYKQALLTPGHSAWSEGGRQLKKGAHNPEWATPILGLCQGVFMNQFIFSTFKGTFSCENRISEVQDIKKEN